MAWPKPRLARLKHPPVSQLLGSCLPCLMLMQLLTCRTHSRFASHRTWNSPLCSTWAFYSTYLLSPLLAWGGVQEGLLFLLPTLAPLSRNRTHSPLGKVLSLSAHGLRSLSHPYKDTSQVTLTPLSGMKDSWEDDGERSVSRGPSGTLASSRPCLWCALLFLSILSGLSPRIT